MQKSLRVFISYSHEDKALLEKFEKHLALLRDQGIITIWYDQGIGAGAEWENEIDSHLEEAHIILLLISPDFMSSHYCYHIEMNRAMDRYEAGSALVIPIILRPVQWQGARFSKLQVLPTGGTPVKSWPDPDEAFVNVVQGIHKEVKKWLMAGAEDLLKNNRKEEALAAFAQVIRLAPEDVEAYRKIVSILWDLNRKEEALKALDRFIGLAPKDVEAHQTKVKLLQNLNRQGDALVALNRVIELAPRDIEAHRAKAKLLQDLNRRTEALMALEKVIGLVPKDIEAHWAKVKLLQNLNRKAEALAALEKVIELAPKDVEAYRAKAEVLQDLNQQEEALVALEQIIELAPEDANAYQEKGRILQKVSRYEEARAAFEQVIRLDPDNVVGYYCKGNALYHLRRYQEAFATYKHAFNHISYFQFFQRDKHPHFYEEVRAESIHLIRSLTSNNAADYFCKGELLEGLGYSEEALIAYRKAISLNPKNVDSYRKVGKLLEGRGNDEEALEAYDSAIQLDPGNFDFYYQKGDILQRLNRNKEAVDVYYQINTVVSNRKCGELLARLGNYEDALDFYNYAIRLNPDHAELVTLCCSKGEALHRLGRNDEALAAYKLAKEYEQAAGSYSYTSSCARRGISEIQAEEHPLLYALYSNLKLISFTSNSIRIYLVVLAALFIYVLILPNTFSILLIFFVIIIMASTNIFMVVAKKRLEE